VTGRDRCCHILPGNTRADLPAPDISVYFGTTRKNIVSITESGGGHLGKQGPGFDWLGNWRPGGIVISRIGDIPCCAADDNLAFIKTSDGMDSSINYQRIDGRSPKPSIYD